MATGHRSHSIGVDLVVSPYSLREPSRFKCISPEFALCDQRTLVHSSSFSPYCSFFSRIASAFL